MPCRSSDSEVTTLDHANRSPLDSPLTNMLPTDLREALR